MLLKVKAGGGWETVLFFRVPEPDILTVLKVL